MEREFYKSICKESIQAHILSDGKFAPPLPDASIPCNSNDIKVHYSFDYAQQVHFPSDPLQPGPIYFLTPRKCSVFGVNCEALPRQINFLTDEAGECGKGANTVVSWNHYFSDHHGIGKKQVVLVPNIGFSTTIYSTTEVHPQHFRKLMCTQYETRWCYCQILVLAPQYPVLPNYTPSSSENSCVHSVKTGGASTKYRF